MFTSGIDSSVNRYIIEGMARVGMGEPFVVTRPLKSNAALRYLWARYRIGLLSEFGLDLK